MSGCYGAPATGAGTDNPAVQLRSREYIRDQAIGDAAKVAIDTGQAT